MMKVNPKYFVLLIFFSLHNVKYSQDYNNSSKGSVSIVSSEFYFVEKVIVGYKYSNSISFVRTRYPIWESLYKCKLIIKLNGNNYSLQEPIKVKLTLPDGRVHEEIFNTESYFLNTEEFYHFTFDLLLQKRIRGWARIELFKHGYNIYRKKYAFNNMYDKATLFID